MTPTKLNAIRPSDGTGAESKADGVNQTQSYYTTADPQAEFYKSLELLPAEMRPGLEREFHKQIRKALSAKQSAPQKMLTKRMMFNYLLRRANGEHIKLDVSLFKDPYRRLWQAMESAAEGKEKDALKIACGDNLFMFNKIMEGEKAAPEFVPFGEMEFGIADVSWFWDYRIPNGKITVIGGEGGVSKSMLALKICQMQIHETSFPDGTPVHNPGAPVLYVDTEGLSSETKKRVNAWGMDKSKFWLWTVDKEEDGFINLSNDHFQDELVEKITQCDPALVVIDSFGNATDEGQDKIQEVRKVLNYLNKIACQFNIAVILIAHTRKPPAMFSGKGEINQDDIKGSSHIVNMARSVMGVWLVQTGPEPDPNGPRLMAVLKANYGKKPKPLGYEVLSDANGNPKMFFVEPPKPYKEPTKIEQCAEWLLDALASAGKPMPPKELESMAAEAGFKRDVLYSAHRKLEKDGRIMDTHGNKSPENCWKAI